MRHFLVPLASSTANQKSENLEKSKMLFPTQNHQIPKIQKSRSLVIFVVKHKKNLTSILASMTGNPGTRGSSYCTNAHLGLLDFLQTSTLSLMQRDFPKIIIIRW